MVYYFKLTLTNKKQNLRKSKEIIAKILMQQIYYCKKFKKVKVLKKKKQFHCHKFKKYCLRLFTSLDYVNDYF